MRRQFILLFLLAFLSGFSQDTDSRENKILSEIEKEFVKATLSYNNLDPKLFEDFEEVLVSLAITTDYTIDDKLVFYKFLYNFIHDINTDLYAVKKIEKQDYRRALRFIPTVFYYKKRGQLADLLNEYHAEASRVLPFLDGEEAVKEYLVNYGLENPRGFYNQIEDFNQIQDFDKVLNLIVGSDPTSWVIRMDKSPYLLDLASKSQSQLIKKVIEIKERMGVNSSLYPFLDDIIKNYFNDSHEWDFDQNKYVLTKKLLAAILDSNAYARVAAANYLSKKGVWVFDEFFDNGHGVLSQFNNNEIFSLLVLTTETNQEDEIGSVLRYINRYDDERISVQTIKSMPDGVLRNFVYKVIRGGNESRLRSILEKDANQFYNNFLAKRNQKLVQRHQDWFKDKYNYRKSLQAKHMRQQNDIQKTFKLNKSQLSLLSWARNINKVDKNINSIVKSSIGNRFVEYLAEYHPNVILKNKDRLKTLPEFPKIVNRLAYYSPNSIKKYLGAPNHIIAEEARKSQEIVPKTILQIYDKHKFNTKAYALIHKIIKKELTIAEAHRIGQTEVPYLKNLMSITVDENPVGIHTVEEEQNQLSLKFIRAINDRPVNSHPNLQEIQQFNAKEVYSLMVLGKEEIFQFAFNHCYNTFLYNLGETSLMDFLPKVNHFKFREFSTLLANFNKFDEVLYRNSTETSRILFLEKMMKLDFTDVNCIEQAAELSEFINNCDHNEIQTIIQNIIKSEYDIAVSKKDQLAMAVYSLLASNIGDHALVHSAWFTEKKKNFSKYSLSYINVEEMKDKNNKIIEVCYFYNDYDGIASFNNYIRMFRKMPNWFIQDLGSYYYISSLVGNEYDIFANKPQNEKLGQQSIRDYLIYNKLEPSIIVHRGHSYHSQKTIDQMVGSPKFIFMGSCGGYYKISELLVRSPNAQILSTKQVGTMSINDPMLKSIRELLRKNQNIDWPDFWEDQASRLRGNENFKMYIPPHKNNGALFVNAFFKVVGL